MRDLRGHLPDRRRARLGPPPLAPRWRKRGRPRAHLATTNYPEQLDRRFVARPRRFDRIVRSGAADEGSAPELPGAEAGGGGPAELERWVGLTEGLSLAALAEAV